MKVFSIFTSIVAAVTMLVFTDIQQHERINRTTAAGLSNWEGRNWYAIGDSITYANQYQRIVKLALGMKSVTTDAIPGQSIRTMADRVTKETLKHIDLITVFGGTNDYGRNTPLGMPGDPPEAATFYGYVKKTIEKLNAAKPNKAKLVFITPLKRGSFKNQPIYPDANQVGARLEDYVNAIEVVCVANKIPVIDLFHHSGLELGNLSKYTKDHLHPNAAGYRKLSKVVVNRLKEVKPSAAMESSSNVLQNR
ncbi:SGNH/GDSL hydrolase family protein [Neobacillus sp. SM06]|uniref:SGNH/GDSL hydrolase family protein n=1 Tax=Neobacillus sp. SM06 TaxID=3422492 RepID=UPI003D26ACBF